MKPATLTPEEKALVIRALFDRRIMLSADRAQGRRDTSEEWQAVTALYERLGGR